MLTQLARSAVAKDEAAARVKARTRRDGAKTTRGAKWASEAKRGLGRVPDHAAAPRDRGVERDQGARTGCSPPARSRTGRASSGTSTSPTAIPGKSLGTATQIGISLGVALAHREQRRLVVDIQPDGDLMFDAGALWVAAKHRIPMLVVMYNNRAYYNDWEHQIRMAQAARHAGRARAHRHGHGRSRRRTSRRSRKSMGWYAEGPIDKPADRSRAALKRAIAQREGRAAGAHRHDHAEAMSDESASASSARAAWGCRSSATSRSKGFRTLATRHRCGEARGGRAARRRWAARSRLARRAVRRDPRLRRLRPRSARARRRRRPEAPRGGRHRGRAQHGASGDGAGASRQDSEAASTSSIPPSAAAARRPTRARCCRSSAATGRRRGAPDAGARALTPPTSCIPARSAPPRSPRRRTTSSCGPAWSPTTRRSRSPSATAWITERLRAGAAQCRAPTNDVLRKWGTHTMAWAEDDMEIVARDGRRERHCPAAGGAEPRDLPRAQAAALQTGRIRPLNGVSVLTARWGDLYVARGRSVSKIAVPQCGTIFGEEEA